MKPHPKTVAKISEPEKLRLSEVFKNWKGYYIKKCRDRFNRIGKPNNPIVHTLFNSPSIPNREKGRRVLIHIQEKVRAEVEKQIKKRHIIKRNKCTSDHFRAASTLIQFHDVPLLY